MYTSQMKIANAGRKKKTANGIKIVHFNFSVDRIEEFAFAEKMICKDFKFNFFEVFLWVAE